MTMERSGVRVAMFPVVNRAAAATGCRGLTYYSVESLSWYSLRRR